MKVNLEVGGLENLKNVEKKEFGKNIHAIIEFARHEIPEKTPEGTSDDYLTSEGKSNASETGKQIKEKNVAGYASDYRRTQETVDLNLQNVDDQVTVINRKLESLENKEAPKNQKGENVFKIKTSSELNVIDNFREEIVPDAQKWADQKIAEGSKQNKYDLIVQFYFENDKLCQERNVSTPRQAATEIAYRVALELGMAQRFYDDSEVRLINTSHSPKLESFLKEILHFDSINEIGGAIKTGESFNFEVNIDEKSRREVKFNFRDRSYNIDENIVKDLAKEYLLKQAEGQYLPEDLENRKKIIKNISWLQ